MTSLDTSADDFTYGSAPTITGLSVTSGAVGGGTTVVITGTNFLGPNGPGGGNVRRQCGLWLHRRLAYADNGEIAVPLGWYGSSAGHGCGGHHIGYRRG